MMDVNLILKNYDLDRLSIAMLASHTSLQIVHGAKIEGFKTVVIVPKNRLWFYKNFSHLIDEYIVVEHWKEVCSSEKVSRLKSLNAIIVPHGSYVEYVGLDCAENIEVPIFGLRDLFRVEADQHLKMDLLQKAGILIPKTFRISDDIDRPVIVKLPGAKGGRGYFVAVDKSKIERVLKDYVKMGIIRSIDEAIIQEYLIGVTAYYHYFYSPVLDRVEIMGADIRYESDVDGLRRIPLEIIEAIDIEPTFTVIGNIPLVLRESLLSKILEYGLRFVDATKKYIPPGIIGPFCLESVIDRDMNITVFEFSGRIVAGTNIYINGSPYSYLYWSEPMSTGRRIAREIKLAIEKNIIKNILT